jgi:hypothetical protein
MTAFRSFASHAIAASTALALSLVLIGGTVSNPTAPKAMTAQEILA